MIIKNKRKKEKRKRRIEWSLVRNVFLASMIKRLSLRERERKRPLKYHSIIAPKRWAREREEFRPSKNK